MRFKILNYTDDIDVVRAAGYAFDCGPYHALCNNRSKVIIFYSGSDKVIAYSPVVKLKKKTVSTLAGMEDSCKMTLTPEALAVLEKHYITLANIEVVDNSRTYVLVDILSTLENDFKLPPLACGVCIIFREHDKYCQRYFRDEVGLANSVLYAGLV